MSRELEEFAELLRKMASSIVANLNSGYNDKSLDIALSLLGQALERKREFTHTIENAVPN